MPDSNVLITNHSPELRFGFNGVNGCFCLLRLTIMSRLGGGLVALGVSAAILSAGVPAQACACGGFLLSEEESVTVSAEFAAIGWDGETERIVLSFGAKTNATDMALLIPTPSPATVSLVDAGLFDELEDFTAPRYERVDQWWPSWFP